MASALLLPCNRQLSNREKSEVDLRRQPPPKMLEEDFSRVQDPRKQGDSCISHGFPQERGTMRSQLQAGPAT